MNSTLNSTMVNTGQVSGVRLAATAAAPPGPQLVLSHVELQQLKCLLELQLRGSVGTLGSIGRQDEGAGQTLRTIRYQKTSFQSEPNLSIWSHPKALFPIQNMALVCIFITYYFAVYVHQLNSDKFNSKNIQDKSYKYHHIYD